MVGEPRFAPSSERVFHTSTPYVTEAEEFVHATNPAMIYVNRPYHDFLVACLPGEKKHYSPIKVEVGRIDFAPLEGLASEYDGHVMMEVRHGQWPKGKESHVFVVVGRRNLYYGSSQALDRHLQEEMTESVRQASQKARRGRQTRRSRYFKRTAHGLVALGLLKAIPIEQAHTLEETIRREFSAIAAGEK